MASMGDVDNADLVAFAESLQKLERDLDDFYNACAREMAARLLALVIPRTPVGDYSKDSLPETYQRDNKKRGIKAGDIKYDKKGNVVRSKFKQVTFTTKRGETVSFKARSVKVGGTLRRGWTAISHEAAAKGGSAKDARAYAQGLKVAKKGPLYEIVVDNPVKYAPYVEYGHRTRRRNTSGTRSIRKSRGWVEGKFMLTISENELRAIQPQLLEQKLKSWIREAGILDDT